MARRHFLQEFQEASLYVGQAFTTGELDLARCAAPAGVEIWVGPTGFRVRQALEATVVDVE